MTFADVVPADAPWAVHATAVAIKGRALLIRGPSKGGKSRLALALVAASTPRRPIILVGDDRVVLTPRDGGLIASPHPRIAGFIERRGLGILSVPFRREAGLAGVVDLVPSASFQALSDIVVMAGLNFPRLSIVVCGTSNSNDQAWHESCGPVLDWFARRDKRNTHR